MVIEGVGGKAGENSLEHEGAMIPHHGTPKLSAVSTGAVNGTVEQLMKFGHGFMGHQVLGLASAHCTTAFQSVPYGSWKLLIPLTPMAAESDGSPAYG